MQIGSLKCTSVTSNLSHTKNIFERLINSPTLIKPVIMVPTWTVRTAEHFPVRKILKRLESRGNFYTEKSKKELVRKSRSAGNGIMPSYF